MEPELVPALGVDVADLDAPVVLVQSAPVVTREDTDGDGKVDTTKVDFDHDGEPEIVEVDNDEDGVVDHFTVNTYSGSDVYHVGVDENFHIDTLMRDTDGDGDGDRWDHDEDGDSVADRFEFDRNGDGQPDQFAHDIDGDGEPDVALSADPADLDHLDLAVRTGSAGLTAEEEGRQADYDREAFADSLYEVPTPGRLDLYRDPAGQPSGAELPEPPGDPIGDPVYGTATSDLDDDHAQPLDPSVGQPSGAEVPDTSAPENPIYEPTEPVYAPVAEASDVDDALAVPDDGGYVG